MFRYICDRSRRIIFFIALLIYFIATTCVLTVFEEYDDVFLRFQFGRQGLYILAADVMAVALVLLLMRCYRAFKDCTWRGALLLFVLMLVLQILFTVFVSRPALISDSARVSQEAIRMLQSDTHKIDMSEPYFQRYGNNHFIVILLYWFYSLLSYFSITDFFTADIVLTVFMLDLGIYLTYRIVRIWRGQRDAVFFLFICLLSPTTYLWLTFTYTTIFGIPFMSAVVYLYLLMRRETTLWKNVLSAILFGLCAVWGFWLRATIIIPCIAIGIVSLLEMIRDLGEKRKLQWREQIVVVAVCILSASCSAAGYQVVHGIYVEDGYEEALFDHTHWVMMGLTKKTEGAFNGADVNFSMKYDTRKERREAEIREIKNRLHQMGLAETVWLFCQKIKRVWAYASDGAFSKSMSNKEFSVAFHYFIGDRNFLFRLYTWSFRAATFLLISLSAFLQLIRRNAKDDALLAVHLTLLGGMLFFAIWEANFKYNLTFMYMAFVLMGDGIRRLRACLYMLRCRTVKKKMGGMQEGIFKRVADGRVVWISMVAIVLAISSSYVHESYNECHHKEILRVPYGGYKRYLYEMEKQGEHITSVKQTFFTDAYETDWDEMEIAFYRTEDIPKKPNKKEWEWRLYSMPSGSLLNSGTVAWADFVIGEDDVSSYYRLADHGKKIKGDSWYEIRMEHVSDKNKVYPIVNYADLVNDYEGGEMYINEQEAGKDMVIHVYKVE